MAPIYWIIICIVLLIIEIATLGLTTIWFAAGALAAFLAGILGFGLPVQIGLFLVVSIVLLVLTRPVALKYFNSRRQKTNVESMIGRQGVVLERIDTIKGQGLVEVDGESWSARTDDPRGDGRLCGRRAGRETDRKGKGGSLICLEQLLESYSSFLWC